MPLPHLVPSSSHVDVQRTAFTTDAMGRFVCNMWEEATGNGGPAFSAVVIGAGAYGAYLAAKLHQRPAPGRILVLDAGAFLISEHVQNLGQIGLHPANDSTHGTSSGGPKNQVWELPWRGNVNFPGLAYCLGGKSLYWGGWCPRLTPQDLGKWPPETAAYLAANYSDVESETGVFPYADFIYGEFADALWPMLVQSTAATPDIETAMGTSGVEQAPLAVQGSSPVSGLFSFDKYSSLPMLIDAVRRDIGSSNGNDALRRIFVVPRTRAVKLHTDDGVVHGLDVDVDGERKYLPIGPRCNVVLSASAIESTRLALHSFPTALMGRNLMAHTRSDFTVRIRRSAFPQLPAHVQTAAFLVRGAAPTGRFHLQITASTSRNGSDELLFRMVPDMDQLQQHLENTDPDWITITVRGIGETHGDRTSAVPNPSGNWVNLSPWDVDTRGVPRAYVEIKLNNDDAATWAAMDNSALALVQSVAGSTDGIEYHYDGGWRSQPFPLSRPFPEWHRGLGSTFHEAGTLWMGADSSSSVTDPSGRFHHISNAYVCDQSAFPTVGSVNPVLTGLTLAKRLAGQLAL